MKTEIIGDTPKKAFVKYPALFRSKSHNYVVLAFGPSAGTVVHDTAASSYCPAHYSDGWINFTDASVWEYIPELTIKFTSAT